MVLGVAGSSPVSHPLQWKSVLQHYDVPRPVELTPVGGTAAPNLRVDSPGGRFILRRRPKAMADPEFVLYDHALRTYLADCGFPAPKPVPTKNGATWVQVDGEIFELSPLLPGTMAPAPNPAMLFDTGKQLATFHRLGEGFHHPGKERFVREDHPSVLLPLVEELSELADDDRSREDFSRVRKELDELCGLWTGPPDRTVLHGDFHPGNVLYDAGRISAVLDYDYAAPGPTARDLGDALMFFAARRKSPFNPDDIRSLTQGWQIDDERAKSLLKGYASVRPLPENLETLRDLMRSRWLQVKLRGARKVPREQKIGFVLSDLWPTADWLKRDFIPWFRHITAQTTEWDNARRSC